jgi:voltage-gated potassium channel
MKAALRPFYKIYISLLIFTLILLSGTIGYMAIEHFTFMEALYMTVITLSTVGYAEVKPLSDAGRAFTIILIILNIGTFTFFISQLSSYFLDGEFLKAYKLYKMKNAINELSGHIIICGFGRNGQEAARIFSNNKKDFVAVERKATRKDDLPFEVKFCLEDDATRDETLIQAGIAKASALITTLPDDADNLFVVLTARELNPKIKIISRASTDSTVKKLKTAGANNVIMPDKIGGTHMATLVISPDVEEFVDLMATQNSSQFSISEIECFKTISLEELDCWKKTGATLLGVKASQTEYTLNPPASTLVKPGNRLIVMGSEEQLRKVKDLLN